MIKQLLTFRRAYPALQRAPCHRPQTRCHAGCAETKSFCKEKRQRHTQEEVGEGGCHEIEHGTAAAQHPIAHDLNRYDEIEGGDDVHIVYTCLNCGSTAFIQKQLHGGDTPGQSVGDPLWAYYGYVCDGIFQNEEEIKNHPTQSMGTPVPGDLKYRDLNGDKVVDSKDRQVLGSYFPKINFGLNLSVQYKDFDLSALLQGAADVKSAPVAEIRYAFYNGGKVTEQHLDRWTPENPNATYPRLSMSDSKNRVTSSFWMQDASYAKLRNLQVGYSLPKQLISKYGISRLRVYCSIDNLFMISGFDGVDPEAISGNYYPLTRNYSFGLNVTF